MYVRVQSSEKDPLNMINPQFHSGGFSVMFWGCFSKHYLGPLKAVSGAMNTEKYVEMFRDELLPELEAAPGPMIFMQDNAPPHKSNFATRFLWKITLMFWNNHPNRLI